MDSIFIMLYDGLPVQFKLKIYKRILDIYAIVSAFRSVLHVSIFPLLPIPTLAIYPKSEESLGKDFERESFVLQSLSL